MRNMSSPPSSQTAEFPDAGNGLLSVPPSQRSAGLHGHVPASIALVRSAATIVNPARIHAQEIAPGEAMMDRSAIARESRAGSRATLAMIIADRSWLGSGC